MSPEYTSTRRVGIEKINLYGGSLTLDLAELARARGLDPDRVVHDYMISRRSLNPLYEDSITMAVNAARPMLSSEDISDIGLLVVGTESATDFGKPISTNVHAALGLSPNVRNYETKHACYSGIAALDSAINWVASGLNHGRKALVIASDFSRTHLDSKEEFVMGGVAAALIVSETPRIIEFELEHRGSWTTDVYDTFRPSGRDEMGNGDLSLYTYMDAVEGAYKDYVRMIGTDVDFRRHFDYLVYHTPFAGMAFQAHRTLFNIDERHSKREVRADFDARVLESLHYSRQLGSTYSCSNFTGLCSLLVRYPDLTAGARIGFFAYGSGAIGEFYSGLLCAEACATVAAMNLDRSMQARRPVSVAEYEQIELARDSAVEQRDYSPDMSLPEDWYAERYAGKGYLVLKRVDNFRRIYEWS